MGEEVRRTKLGHQLNSVRLIVDREDFPNVEACAILIKEALSAILQAAGISYSLTGRAYKEKATEGAITVDLNGDSCKCQGLQCVDILLQVVQRQLPGFSAAGG